MKVMEAIKNVDFEDIVQAGDAKALLKAIDKYGSGYKGLSISSLFSGARSTKDLMELDVSDWAKQISEKNGVEVLPEQLNAILYRGADAIRWRKGMVDDPIEAAANSLGYVFSLGSPEFANNEKKIENFVERKLDNICLSEEEYNNKWETEAVSKYQNKTFKK